MRYFYRYIIGVAIGVAIAFVLPRNAGSADELVIVADIALRLGRYVVIPIIFFSLAIAVTRLRRIGTLGKVLRRGTLYALGAAAIASAVGTVVTWVIEPRRLPVIPADRPPVVITSWLEITEGILDLNPFRILVGDPTILLPLCALSFLLGWHFHHDREVAEPAFNLFDSLSRIFYRAGRYILVLMPGLLALVTARTAFLLRDTIDFVRYLPLIGLTALAVFLLVGGIYPLVLWLLGNRRSPWRDVFGIAGAMWGALATGSSLFNYGNLIVHLKENVGVPRRTAAVLVPLGVMFARAGTAVVVAVGMLTIIRSYSSLEITLFQASWTALFAFLISFSLPAVPEGGIATAFVLLGSLYGRGLEEGWLILVPVLSLLMMIASFGDSATTAFITILVSRKGDDGVVEVAGKGI